MLGGPAAGPTNNYSETEMRLFEDSKFRLEGERFEPTTIVDSEDGLSDPRSRKGIGQMRENLSSKKLSGDFQPTVASRTKSSRKELWRRHIQLLNFWIVRGRGIRGVRRWGSLLPFRKRRSLRAPAVISKSVSGRGSVPHKGPGGKRILSDKL